MDVPIGIRLGEALAAAGYDSSLDSDYDGGFRRRPLEAGRTTYEVITAGGFLGLGRTVLGTLSVTEPGRLRAEVRGRENQAEMERVAAAVAGMLELPADVVLAKA